jgi:hypothetical protein
LISKKRRFKHDISLIEKMETQKNFLKRSMTISSPEREAKKVKIAVDRNPVETSFEKWACDLKKGDNNKFIKMNTNVSN